MLRHWMTRGALVLGLALTFGCSQEALVEKMSSPQERAEALDCIDSLRQGKLDELERRMHPSIASPDLRATLQKMAEIMPQGDPKIVKLVGVNKSSDSNGSTVNLTYQFGFGARWFLANCALLTNESAVSIVGMSVQPLDKPYEEARFELKARSPQQYAFLATALAAVLVSLTAFVMVILDHSLRRRWAWVIFTLFGFFTFTMNWETAEIQFQALSFLLFSAGLMAEPYGPWMVSVSVPVGALLYLVRRFLNLRTRERSDPS